MRQDEVPSYPVVFVTNTSLDTSSNRLYDSVTHINKGCMLITTYGSRNIIKTKSYFTSVR